MPIVDSHHHLWDPAKRVYPWMDDSVAPIRKRFDTNDLQAAVTERVARTIVVAAANVVDETRELLRIALGSDLVGAVVGWVDLTAPDVGERLAQLREGPGGRRLVGIRHLVHDESDPQWLLRDDVIRGLEAVAAAGLCYDLLVRTRELPAAVAVARRLPQLTLVLDHAAKPEIRAQRWEPWKTHIATLATCANVTCKISGLVTEADHRTWQPDDIIPYVAYALELFTPNRLLFGSDWPVCLLAASYTQVLDLACAAFAGLSVHEQAKIFHDNAQRIYLERAA